MKMALGISKLLLEMQKIKRTICLSEAVGVIKETQAVSKEKFDQNVVVILTEKQKQISKRVKSGLWIGLQEYITEVIKKKIPELIKVLVIKIFLLTFKNYSFFLELWAHWLLKHPRNCLVIGTQTFLNSLAVGSLGLSENFTLKSTSQRFKGKLSSWNKAKTVTVHLALL